MVEPYQHEFSCSFLNSMVSFLVFYLFHKLFYHHDHLKFPLYFFHADSLYPNLIYDLTKAVRLDSPWQDIPPCFLLWASYHSSDNPSAVQVEEFYLRFHFHPGYLIQVA